VSGFDPAWLALREPADIAARDAGLLAAAAAHLDASGGEVLDLGCGTGSTVRVLMPVIGRPVRWRLLDNDPVLLDEAIRRVGESAQAIAIQADLADVAALPIQGVGLVTASALLDLVSASWVERLAARLAQGRVGLYAALNYDGTLVWDDPHPLDGALLQAFNTHQTSDKGLGLALGPAATQVAGDCFRELGWKVATASSPWRLGSSDLALQRQLIAGIADAAVEAGVSQSAAAQWRDARTARASRSGCIVGHDDLLVLPAA